MAIAMAHYAPKIILESESELSDMNESVDSYQMNLTASCQDTPDTDSSSLDELSVASSSSDNVSLPNISSGPDDIYEMSHETELVSHNHPLVKRKCIKCHVHERSFSFLFCRKCFQERKRFLPPPPQRRKKAVHRTTSLRMKDRNQLEPSTSSDAIGQMNLSLSLCGCCMERPSNGIFIHGDIGHQIFCYICSHRIWLERKKCPYCNQSIAKVVKLFQVEHSFS